MARQEGVRWRRGALGLLAVAGLGLSAGCGSSDSSVRLLDRVCGGPIITANEGEPPAPPACTIAGDAEQITGVTGDSIGYHFGPKTGSLTIRLDALIHTGTGVGGTVEFWLDVLAASTRPEGSMLYRTLTWGNCAACPDDPADGQAAFGEDFEWVKAVEPVALADTLSLPDDAEVTFRGADLDLADIRAPTAE